MFKWQKELGDQKRKEKLVERSEDSDLMIFPEDRKSKNYKVVYRKGRKLFL